MKNNCVNYKFRVRVRRTPPTFLPLPKKKQKNLKTVYTSLSFLLLKAVISWRHFPWFVCDVITAGWGLGPWPLRIDVWQTRIFDLLLSCTLQHLAPCNIQDIYCTFRKPTSRGDWGKSNGTENNLLHKRMEKERRNLNLFQFAYTVWTFLHTHHSM